MSSLPELESGLDQACTAVDAAREMVADGSFVDLASLETHVEALCAALLALPAGQSANLKPTLIKLMDQLDGLTRSIVAQNDKLSVEIQGVSARQRATSAYNPGPDRSGKPPRK